MHLCIIIMYIEVLYAQVTIYFQDSQCFCAYGKNVHRRLSTFTHDTTFLVTIEPCLHVMVAYIQDYFTVMSKSKSTQLDGPTPCSAQSTFHWYTMNTVCLHVHVCAVVIIESIQLQSSHNKMPSSTVSCRIDASDLLCTFLLFEGALWHQSLRG